MEAGNLRMKIGKIFRINVRTFSNRSGEILRTEIRENFQNGSRKNAENRK